MTNEERRKLHAEQKQKYYQECTDDIYLLYQSFRRSGFDPDQAFELTTTYVRQTVLDNAMRANVKEKPDYRAFREAIERNKEKNNAGTNE